MKFLKINSGFTIIELIIYMGIFSVLLLMFVQIFSSAMDAQYRSEASSSITQDGQFILERVTYDIKRATDISIPLNIGDESPELQIVIEGITHRYYLSDGNLVLTDNSGDNKLNGFNTNIKSLLFKRYGNNITPISGINKDLITIVFVIQSKTLLNSPAEEKTFQTTVGVR